MKNVFKVLAVFLSFFFVSNIAWAACECEGSQCTLSCINNFGGITDTSLKSQITGDKCGPNKGEMTLDEVCKKKGFKGVAPHDKNSEDRPALWCPDARCK